MATRAAKVIPGILQEARSIVDQMAALEGRVNRLRALYTQAGGATMDGIDAYDFASHGLGADKTLFVEGMTDLSTAHNAIALSNVLVGGGFAKVVVVASGA